MIGNLRGWLFAGGVLFIEVLVVIWALSLDNVSPPTELGSDADRLRPLTLSPDPRSIVPATGIGDAATLYRQALDAFRAEQTQFIRFTMNRQAEYERIARESRAIGLLRQASKLPPAMILSDRIDRVIVQSPGDRTDLVDLARLGALTRDIGLMFEREEKWDQAQPIFEAIHVLGANFAAERLVYQQLAIGIELMGDALASLESIAQARGDSAGVQHITAINNARKQLGVVQDPMARAIFTVNAGTIARHAGDVFVFASDRNQERMWRVEAIMKLGRMRFDIGQGRVGDQVAARRVLSEIADRDPDPVIKLAATRSRDMTELEYRGVNLAPPDFRR